MKIVLIEQDEVLAKKISVTLEMSLKATVVHVKTAKDAMIITKSSKELELIIGDYAALDGNTQGIYDYIKENGLNVPFIWLTYKSIEDLKSYRGLEHFEQDHPGNAHILKFMCFSVLEETVNRALAARKNFVAQVTPPSSLTPTEEVAPAPESAGDGPDLSFLAGIVPKTTSNYVKFDSRFVKDYVKIPVKRFFFKNNNEYDIYSYTEDGQFIKIIDKETMTAADLLKCRRSYNYFFIPLESYISYAPLYLDSVKKILFESNSPIPDKITTQMHALSFVHDVFHQLEDKQEAIDFTTLLVNSIYETTLVVEGYWPIFKTILKNKDHVLEKSLSMAYFGSLISFNLQNTDPNLYRPLITTGLFHDISLTYHDYLSKCHNEQDISSFPEEEKKIFRGHTKRSDELMRGVEDYNEKVMEAILYHHETKNMAIISEFTATFQLVQLVIEKIISLGSEVDKEFMDQLITEIKGYSTKSEHFNIAVNNVLDTIILLIDELS